MKRVVITRAGVITPNGEGLEAFWGSLKKGRSGLCIMDRFNTENFSSRATGQIRNFDTSELFDTFPELIKVQDIKVLFGMAALMQIARPGDEYFRDCAINLGTSLESFNIEKLFSLSPHKFDIDTYVAGLKEKSGQTLLQTPLDYLGNFIKKTFRVSGPNYLNCSACAASTQAIGHSFRIIKDGRYKRIITGGFDSMLNPVALGGFSKLGALSTENDFPEKAIRPFDRKRNGTVLGEGAAVFLIEDLDSALGNGSEILCEIAGYASSFDAYKLSDPEPGGAGISYCMEKALAEASVDCHEVDYINAHGTGTISNDRVETTAIKNVFGKVAYQIPISSIKSMTGHLIGASGAVEIAGIMGMLKHDFIAPTINLENHDPDCDLNYVPNNSIHGRISTVLKNSMGFGGQNASLVIKRYNGGC